MSRITHHVNKKLAREIVQKYENFLFDCDGVLYHGNEAIPGCAKALQKLKQLGKRVFYVTNNSSKTRAQMVEKCQSMGYPAEPDSIICTAHTAALYLKRMNFEGKVYMVGNPSMEAECDALGIKHEGSGPDTIDPNTSGFDCVTKYQKDWKQNPEINCVLVGFDPHLSYVKMIKASTYARNPNNLFLATNEDYFLPHKGDVVIPGTGSIVAAIKIPTRREPHVLGKPGTAMFDLLHEIHGLDADKCVMVGDNLQTDIAMAVNCEMKSMLVLTGVDDLQRIEANQQSDDPHKRQIVPDFYMESFGDMAEHLQDL
ncbi:glycerol-3-phosphate phosphatase-like [Mya arenaria]|uniref:glycerol-3-phosphate phosphatase-like n=1 Tax=Mya arenaria TaxID=6604 RepID=UPI0022E44FE8|nr:glycerol-3-phosphate phosphatase-like [Mya arenaria]